MCNVGGNPSYARRGVVKNDFPGGAVLPDATPLGRGWALRRLRLGLLATHRAASGSRFRGLGWSAGLLALSGVLSIAFLSRVGAAEVGDVLALRLLAYASWLYGGLGLAALLAPRADDANARQLALLRGRIADETSSLWIGMAARIATGVFLAALPGLLVAWAVAPAQFVAARAWLFPASFVYAIGLGASLGGVGALSLRIAPRSPRLVAAGLVLVPYALALSAPSIPSIPGFFALLLNQMLQLGGRTGV